MASSWPEALAARWLGIRRIVSAGRRRVVASGSHVRAMKGDLYRNPGHCGLATDRGGIMSDRGLTGEYCRRGAFTIPEGRLRVIEKGGGAAEFGWGFAAGVRFYHP
jgi:hypothetical protein